MASRVSFCWGVRSGIRAAQSRGSRFSLSMWLHAGPEDAQVVFREQDVVEHPGHRVVADGGLEGVQGRPVPQVEGLQGQAVLQVLPQ